MTVICAVYDSKAEAYLTPIFQQSRGTALRAFQAAAQKSDHDFHVHAGDYSLFELGLWDETTGQIHMHEAPVNLGLALHYIDAAS